MQIITDTESLQALCGRYKGAPYIALDTEFIREKTYYPRLCLIQIATPGEAAIIDPLASGIDLAPLFALLADASIVKVFHAGRQDIEIFHMLTGTIPDPVFDTQIAAAVLGYGASIGYEGLVQSIVQASLDKGSRYSDWSARPLTEAQLSYALSDVTHLCVIYEKLKAKLDDKGRSDWVAEEHGVLIDPATYETKPEDAWRRLKYGQMKPKNLAVLRALAVWRETEARGRDVPRGRILKDDALIELALALPRSETDFKRMRNMDRGLPTKSLEAVLKQVNDALASPAADWPQTEKTSRLDSSLAPAIAMLQMLLKIESEQSGVASNLIADKDELEDLAQGKGDLPCLQGWRAELFGNKAQALLAGKLKLVFDPKKRAVIFTE